MQMMLSVEGMDVDMESPSYVWNTHEFLLVSLVHQEVVEEEEEQEQEKEEEEEQLGEEVDLQHEDQNSGS